MYVSILQRTSFALLIAASLAASTVEGAVLYAANNGKDSPTCGARTAPCRSISRAIEHANDGDQIEVGPGRYGDLNGNQSRDPGDEQFDNLEQCAVCIDKAVAVFAQHGAAATIIDLANTTVVSRSIAVRVRGPNVTFGRAGHGFTVTGATIGISIEGPRTRVGGNVAVDNIIGFSIHGTLNTIEDNVASFNGNGFNGANGEVLDCCASPSTLSRNVATDNGEFGFFFEASDYIFNGNVARHNARSGFGLVGLRFTLENNTAVDNKGSGIAIGRHSIFQPGDFGSGIAVRRMRGNTIVGNRGGVVLSLGAVVQDMQMNNIFGNETGSGPLSNCGLLNHSGMPTPVPAVNNFWGAATGPGADPADNAGPGSGCDLLNEVFGVTGVTTVVPFATKQFPVFVP
jgi:hypothetical protein